MALAIASPSQRARARRRRVLSRSSWRARTSRSARASTPWNAEHIAERYGLLVIITLGEVILGTVASLNAVVHGEAGWSLDAALLAVAGVGLTFGCWWMYFSVPWAEPLVRHRERAFPSATGTC